MHYNFIVSLLEPFNLYSVRNNKTLTEQNGYNLEYIQLMKIIHGNNITLLYPQYFIPAGSLIVSKQLILLQPISHYIRLIKHIDHDKIIYYSQLFRIKITEGSVGSIQHIKTLSFSSEIKTKFTFT